MLDNKLIESALQLTGKTMEDMQIVYKQNTKALSWEFSIEKFCYYLLSEGFIVKYLEEVDYENNPDYCDDEYPIGYAYSQFGVAIGEYQSGNETPLIELLSTICPTDQTM